MTLKAADLKPGQSVSQVVAEDLTRTQIVQYAGASGDYNPLHTDEPFARDVAGYPGVFAHGMLTMGMTGRLLTDWVGNGQLLEYGVRFTAQVWPGDTLTATATIREITERDGTPVALIDIVTINQSGATVVAGSAAAHLEA